MNQYNKVFKVIESPDNQITAYFARKRETEQEKARKPNLVDFDGYTKAKSVHAGYFS